MPSEPTALVEGVPSKNSAGWPYFLVALALGALLVVAGTLKIGPWLSGISTTGGSASSLLPGLAIAFELLFGLWLMLGLVPRLTRCIALGCFFGFLNIALFKALEGDSSCKCFGNVPLTPWIAVTIDVAAIGALLLSPVQIDRPVSSSALRWKLGAFGFASLLVVAAGLTSGAVLAERSPIREHNALVDRIVYSIERNDSQIQTTQFRASFVHENALVKKEETLVVESPGKKLVGRRAPRFEEQYIYVLNGRQIRREMSHNKGGLFKICVVNQGRQLDYNGPTAGFQAPPTAWMRWYPVGLGAEPDDPRCIGFEPQTTSVIDWLRQVVVEQASPIGDSNDIFVRAVDDKGQRVEVAFSRAHSYLPVQICYWYSDGSLRDATTINYRKLPGTQAWFIELAAHRIFGPGEAHAPDATNWRIRTTFRRHEGTRVNHDLGPATFNPMLGKGVLFIDGISPTKSAHSYRLTKSQPAFEVVNARIPATGQTGNAPATRQWIVLALLDMLALIGLVVCHRQLCL